jgi:hypothetical protein
LRRQIQQLHQDETTEQREMRFDLQLHMRDVTAAHYTNRQMQMVHWMQMQNLTSDFRNLAKRSFLMDSNIVRMQEDLHVQDEKQQLRMHNVTAALDANLHMQMQHWMQMQNLTSEFRNFRTWCRYFDFLSEGEPDAIWTGLTSGDNDPDPTEARRLHLDGCVAIVPVAKAQLAEGSMAVYGHKLE